MVLADYLNLTTGASANATFVSTMHGVIVDYFTRADNASTSDELAKLEFSHVDLSDTVVFDSLTIEIPTQKLGEQEDSSSSSNPFYQLVTEETCNTQACLVSDIQEFMYTITNFTNSTLNDSTPVEESVEAAIYPRIQAVSICLNEAGKEELTIDPKYQLEGFDGMLQACKQRSNTSMIIISLGKRVEGDSLLKSTRTDSEDYLVSSDMVNARMVYSLTVGRLSWIPEDLSDVYGAEYASDDGCSAIRFPLEQGDDSIGSDILLVGNSNIPMDLLSPIDINTDWRLVSSTQWKVLAATVDVGN